MSFFDELKRRNVFRVGIAYLVVAWLVLQVTDTVAPILELPDVFGRGVLLLLAIGFPLVLFFAWAFELTPEGIKKEKDVDQNRSISPVTGRKLDLIIIGMLTIAVAIFTLDKFVWTNSPTQRTIAVLALANLSDDPDQEYFSDGLSEELLNLLAQIPELRVTSRTSAFSFKGRDVTIPEVGRILNVEHVLDGSVRRSGDTIRITVQLIEVSTDTQLWSETWDRDFEEVFVIQDEIAEFVVDALKIQLLGDVPQVFETAADAYELYLQAKFLMTQGNPSSYQQAEAINKRALAIDPDYAPAWTQRAMLYLSGPAYGAWESNDVAPLAREAALTSMRLFENDAEAHALLARIAYQNDFDYELAARELEIALKLGPDNVIVLRAAEGFEQRQGNYEEAIRYVERRRTIDPINRFTGSESYYFSGRHVEGIALFEEAVKDGPFTEFIHKRLALALLESGDIDGAFAALEKEPAEGNRLQGLAIIYEAMGDRERSTEALEKLLAISSRWTFEIAEVHSYRGEIDEAFEWMDRAIERHDQGLRHVTPSPYLDNMREDPRFDNVLVRIGLKPAP